MHQVTLVVAAVMLVAYVGPALGARRRIDLLRVRRNEPGQNFMLAEQLLPRKAPSPLTALKRVEGVEQPRYPSAYQPYYYYGNSSYYYPNVQYAYEPARNTSYLLEEPKVEKKELVDYYTYSPYSDANVYSPEFNNLAIPSNYIGSEGAGSVSSSTQDWVSPSTSAQIASPGREVVTAATIPALQLNPSWALDPAAANETKKVKCKSLAVSLQAPDGGPKVPVIYSVFPRKHSKMIELMLTSLFVGINFLTGAILVILASVFFFSRRRGGKGPGTTDAEGDASDPEKQILLNHEDADHPKNHEGNLEEGIREMSTALNSCFTGVQEGGRMEGEVIAPVHTHPQATKVPAEGFQNGPKKAECCGAVWSPLSLLGGGPNACSNNPEFSNKHLDLHPKSRDSNDTFTSFLGYYGESSHSLLSHFIEKQSENFDKLARPSLNGVHLQIPADAPNKDSLEQKMPLYPSFSNKGETPHSVLYSPYYIKCGQNPASPEPSFGFPKAGLVMAEANGPQYILRYKMTESGQNLKNLMAEKNGRFGRYGEAPEGEVKLPTPGLHRNKRGDYDFEPLDWGQLRCPDMQTLQKLESNIKKLPTESNKSQNFVQKSKSSPHNSMSFCRQSLKPPSEDRSFLSSVHNWSDVSKAYVRKKWWGTEPQSCKLSMDTTKWSDLDSISPTTMSQDVSACKSYDQLQNSILKEVASLEKSDLSKVFISKWDSLERLFKDADYSKTESIIHSFFDIVPIPASDSEHLSNVDSSANLAPIPCPPGSPPRRLDEGTSLSPGPVSSSEASHPPGPRTVYLAQQDSRFLSSRELEPEGHEH